MTCSLSQNSSVTFNARFYEKPPSTVSKEKILRGTARLIDLPFHEMLSRVCLCCLQNLIGKTVTLSLVLTFALSIFRVFLYLR